MTIEDVTKTNADLYEPGQRFAVRRANIADPNTAREQAVATPNAVRFNRLEGAFFKNGVFWFDDTNGGEDRLGQIFRYFPKSNTLELFYEGKNPARGRSAQDREPRQHHHHPLGRPLVRRRRGRDRRQQRQPRRGRHPRRSDLQLCPQRQQRLGVRGPDLLPRRPDFLRQHPAPPGLTLAIWGPFRDRNARRQARMSVAAPPKELAPRVSGDLAEAVNKYGMGTLEAAAFDRLTGSLA